MALKIGDKISTLHDDTKGKILKIENNTATVLTDYGFEQEYLLTELVNGNDFSKKNTSQSTSNKKKTLKEKKDKKEKSVAKLDAKLKKLANRFPNSNQKKSTSKSTVKSEKSTNSKKENQKKSKKKEIKEIKTFKIGDKVSVLHHNIRGKILNIHNKVASILTEDGFNQDYPLEDLVNGSEFNVEVTADTIQNKKTRSNKKKAYSLPEFDLHIEKLIKDHSSLSKHAIIQIQLKETLRVIEKMIEERIPKIILIHGEGEGVLKDEVSILLERYWTKLSFIDANYNRYKNGALELTLFQSEI